MRKVRFRFARLGLRKPEMCEKTLPTGGNQSGTSWTKIANLLMQRMMCLTAAALVTRLSGGPIAADLTAEVERAASTTSIP